MKKEDFDNLPNRYDEDRKLMSQYIVLEEYYDDDDDNEEECNDEEEYDEEEEYNNEEEYDEEDDDDNWELVDYFNVSYACVDLNDNSFYWVRMNGDEVKEMLEMIEEKDTKYRIRYVLGNDGGSWINVKIKPVAKLYDGTVYFEKDDSGKCSKETDCDESCEGSDKAY